MNEKNFTPNDIIVRPAHKMRLRLLWRYFRRRFFKYVPPTLFCLIIILISFIAGFVYFSEKIYNQAAPAPLIKADAIIVLTGAEKRLEAGLALLEQGYGQRLLISGVNRKTNSQTLIRITHSDPELFNCCVDIDYEAENTLGNAIESQKWIVSHGYKKIYIVTHNYHMPRSLREFARHVKNVALIPYPIDDKNENNDIIHEFNQLRLIMSEYIKFMGAEIRGLIL